ncbi:hypothetical protein ACI8AA_01120 [Geodermatophilus sp. SYSU D01180]
MSISTANHRLALIQAAAVLCLGAFSSTAAAAPTRDVSPCKNNGFSQYLDPTTGHRFADQGTCVSFVRNGGALKPYVERVPLEYQGLQPYSVGPDTCGAYLYVKGTPNVAYPYEITVGGEVVQSGEVVLGDGTPYGYPAGTGYGYVQVNSVPDDSVVTLSSDGTVVTTVTPDCEAEAPPATIESSFFPYSGGQCTWNVRLSGYPANSEVTVDLRYTNASGFPTTQQRVTTTDANGGSYFTAEFPLYGGTATASTTSPAASDDDTVRC